MSDPRTTSESPAAMPTAIDRYLVYSEIAAGGMATVHLGVLRGEGGFSRTVAIKRLHRQYAVDPEFCEMFLDEARLASRIRHANVVATLDVVARDGELLLVMEYVHGESLFHLQRGLPAVEGMPIPLACGIVAQALQGLHAAHEATSERGEPLGLVHRDVSPQNIMVGVDGVARMVDFGVAKQSTQLSRTQPGQLKGKLSYMAPERFTGEDIDRRLDIFGVGVVLWEALTGRRLFQAKNPAMTTSRILKAKIRPPSDYRPEVPPELDEAVMRALSRFPEDRFATAHEFASALGTAVEVAPPHAIGDWVAKTAATELAIRSKRLAEIETGSAVMPRLQSAQGALSTLPPPHRKLDRSRVAAIAVAMLLAGLLGWFWAPQDERAPAALEPEPTLVAPAPRSDTPAPTDDVAVPSTPPVSEEPRTTETQPPTPPAPGASAGQAPPGASAAGTPPDTPRRHPRKRKPRATAERPGQAKASRAPAGTSCDPPYTIDARGIRRVKTHCL